MRLTDLQIRKLKAPGRGQRTFFDEALPGFGVRVSQGGTKAFVVMQGKARRLRTIGRYPEMGLAEARIEAKRVQAEMALEVLAGPEPDLALGSAAPPPVPFAAAKERFLADCAARTKPRTLAEYRRLLDRHFAFEEPVTALRRAAIMAAVSAIKGAPSEQKHAFVAIRTLMNWCVRHGLLEVSPVPPLAFAAPARSRVLTDDELVAVWHRAGEVGYPYGTMVRLLILTGQRRGEIAALRRGWIADGALAFPEGFTKNKRAHVVPLGERAQAILADTPETGELLFPARGSTATPFNGWSKAKRGFDQPLGLAPWTLHDLRRTFSSSLARLGTPIHVTEKLLNHVSGTLSGVAAVYNRHSYLPEMRAAVAAFEGWLGALVGEGGRRIF